MPTNCRSGLPPSPSSLCVLAIEDRAKLGPLSRRRLRRPAGGSFGAPSPAGEDRVGLARRRETGYQRRRGAFCEATVGFISDATVELVRGIGAEAERIETPCGDGTMVWRRWGEGPPLVLLHGGYGSWMHWIRNVLPLSRQFRVIAPDLPGLGESATPPEPWTAEGLAAIIAEGLASIVDGERLHLAGFSFGGVIGGNVAAQLGDQVRGFTVVGSNGLGLTRSRTDLRRVSPDAGEEEEFATHR